MFALLDEPEKRVRWAVFAVGAVIAGTIQGTTIYSAAQYTPPPKKNQILVEMAFFAPPPPPPPTAPPPPPPPTAPPPPPTAAPTAPPPPKQALRPNPEPPRPDPPKDVPLQAGIDANSTVTTGDGPAFQQGNTQMGEPARVARPAITDRPPPAPPTRAPVPLGPPVVVDARIIGKPATSNDDYTLDARDAGVEGEVIVIATVDEKGFVVDARVAKPLGYGLDEKALALARKYRFSPKTINGIPTRTTYRIPIKFALED